MKLQQKVQNYIHNHQLLTHNKPIIVGVSGGADSVALLQVLIALGYNCVAAHCNFKLRMEESDRDELFVRKLATWYGIPYYTIDFETVVHSKTHKISIEMAARDLRYAWFNDLAQQLDAQAIAVAHHADDSIETMLMNLVRGTGLRGLTGISPRNANVVRPLLCCNRTEIEDYLEFKKLDYVTDSSNLTLDYTRNKFRNQLIPLLTTINPSIRETLYESVNRLEGTRAIFQRAIDEIERKIVSPERNGIRIDIELLRNEASTSTVLFEILSKYGFSASNIEQINEHLDGESGKQFYSNTHRLLKDRKYLLINELVSFDTKEYTIAEEITKLSTPIQLKLCKLQRKSNFIVSKQKHCIHIDYNLLKFPLTLRRWKEGDTFFPFGMNQHKKISDFFIDNKINTLEKEKTWLLVSDDKVVWIIGQRMDNRFRITDKTTAILEIELMLG